MFGGRRRSCCLREAHNSARKLRRKKKRMVGEKSVDIRLRTALPRRDPGSCQELQRLLPGQSKLQRNCDESSHRRGQVECFHQPFQIRPTILWSEGARRVHFFNVLLTTPLRRSHLPRRDSTGMFTTIFNVTISIQLLCGQSKHCIEASQLSNLS